MKTSPESDKVNVESAFRSMPATAAQKESEKVDAPASMPNSVPLSVTAGQIGSAHSGQSKKKWIVGCAALALVCSLGGYLAWSGMSGQAPSAELSVSKSAPAVKLPESVFMTSGQQALPSFEKSYFAYNSSTLSKSDKARLRAAAASLKAMPKATIRVAGYADEIGGTAFNLKLSEKRAMAASVFLEKNGVPKSQIKRIAFGEANPAVKGKAETARKWNRRVEISEIQKPVAATAKR